MVDPASKLSRVRMRRVAALCLALALAGVAPARAEGPASSDPDPFVRFNRAMFEVNEALDRWIFEPVATGYERVVPDRAEGWIDNFFANLRFPIVFANCLLQGKGEKAVTSLGRFLVNTSVGIAGFGDPAGDFGMPEPNEDFGQTLGAWGIRPGPYLVLPLLGPSSIRDGAGAVADSASRVWPYFAPTEATIAGGVVSTLNTRALHLESVASARRSALDFYVFVRDAYLQRRQALVEDRVDGFDEDSADDEPASDDLYFYDDEES